MASWGKYGTRDEKCMETDKWDRKDRTADSFKSLGGVVELC
jgi:hypothetical protein